MRELTKSMLSFSWAMPLFGMKQMLNLSMPQDMSRPFGSAADGYGAVTEAMRKEMGPTMRGLFDVGDQIQRGLVDMMFSVFSFQAFDPNALMRMSSDMMQRSMQGMQQGMPGSAGAAFGGTATTSATGGPSVPPGWASSTPRT
ncbi:MAG TPA: hypothetical protein VF756_13020 [Thermoanaerobaculia bacterium]